ncbi:hypothetical protein [Acidaminococcus timonensis]|uniref:hypothetical protein n=1 Tax=Acidaminococcus timonensis TaxID=1871002 RepID=UPI0025F42395|nr:hypothetical protein [Acidaminococcus timonensis]
MTDTSVAYKCPNCGGPLEFQPGASQVVCPYCDTKLDVAQMEALFARQQERAAAAQEAKEERWNTEMAGKEWSTEEASVLKAFTCSACGAEIVCDENTLATECCYCGNPTMMPNRFSGMLKPDYVIPFTKTKDDAVAALKEFYKGKRLLPAAFTANNRVQDIQPMYVPFWLFDSKIHASADFQGEDDNVMETSDEIITETRVFQCIRSGRMSFHKIPVDGSSKMDDTYMESIEPFDYSKMVPFSPAYLTGFLADKYDVDAEASVPRADERVERSAVGVLEETVKARGYDRTILKDSVVRKDEDQVAYALAPVWILTTRYQDKPYTFMMNGQTGKMVGTLPYDNQKSLMIMGAVAAILTPALYFVAKMFLT